MITKSIVKAFKIANERNWEKIYVAVDIHDTIVVSNYSTSELPTEFFPNAKYVLQYLSKRKDVILILYSSSFPWQMRQYIDFFKSFDIKFKYANCNPEVENKNYGYYNDKFYFNVLIEDKAGFDTDNDWFEVYNAFLNNKIKDLIVQLDRTLVS